MAAKFDSAAHPRGLTRETNELDPIKHETLMVRLEADGKRLTLWAKGRRLKYTLRYSDVYRFAYQQQAHAAREG